MIIDPKLLPAHIQEQIKTAHHEARLNGEPAIIKVGHFSQHTGNFISEPKPISEVIDAYLDKLFGAKQT